MLRSIGQLINGNIRQTLNNRIKLYSTETLKTTSIINQQSHPPPTITDTQQQQQQPQNAEEISSPIFGSSYPQQETEELDKLYSKLEIELKGIDPAVVKSYSWFATTAANHLGIEMGKCWTPRKADKKRLTLLKCVHIFRKHRVQYEIRTYYRFLQFHKLTGSTLDTFLEYIQRNLPEGVALKATKVEIQQLPKHLKSKPSTTTE